LIALERDGGWWEGAGGDENRVAARSDAPTPVLLQHGFDFEEEVGLEKGLVSAVVGPGADDAGAVAVPEA